MTTWGDIYLALGVIILENIIDINESIQWAHPDGFN
jgi:hypothetical protein